MTDQFASQRDITGNVCLLQKAARDNLVPIAVDLQVLRNLRDIFCGYGTAGPVIWLSEHCCTPSECAGRSVIGKEYRPLDASNTVTAMMIATVRKANTKST